MRKKSEGRRMQIFVAMEEEANENTAQNENITTTVSDGKQRDKDWDGVVGFLHPFWYSISFSS